MTPPPATVVATIDSPIGPLVVEASESGVRSVRLPGESLAVPPADPGAVRSDAARAHLDRTVRQLGEYFAGERTEFDLDLDPVGTEFQCSAWAALRTIPFGETVSYGEQAARMGDRRKARAVGAANGRNPIPIIVPCHRVVGADGTLTGFAGGIEMKAWLLAHERSTLV
jgi:methylated-DNA-[protein]-cysteine S-methyltransferase